MHPRHAGVSLLLCVAVACVDVSVDLRPEKPSTQSPPLVETVRADPDAQRHREPSAEGRSGPWVAFPLEGDLSVLNAPKPRARRLERLPLRNAFGQWLPLLALGRVHGQDRSWVRVRLPDGPNGSVGWVRSQDVELRPIRDRIVVDLSDRRMWRYHRGRLTDRFRVAVGSPATPTTPGNFYVWPTVTYDDPLGPYGTYALGLNGFSEVLTGWPGGGRMAIHGTANPLDLGRRVSHGCVRVLNSQLRRLHDVPLGTPVVLRP